MPQDLSPPPPPGKAKATRTNSWLRPNKDDPFAVDENAPRPHLKLESRDGSISTDIWLVNSDHGRKDLDPAQSTSTSEKEKAILDVGSKDGSVNVRLVSHLCVLFHIFESLIDLLRCPAFINRAKCFAESVVEGWVDLRLHPFFVRWARQHLHRRWLRGSLCERIQASHHFLATRQDSKMLLRRLQIGWIQCVYSVLTARSFHSWSFCRRCGELEWLLPQYHVEGWERTVVHYRRTRSSETEGLCE